MRTGSRCLKRRINQLTSPILSFLHLHVGWSRHERRYLDRGGFSTAVRSGLGAVDVSTRHVLCVTYTHSFLETRDIILFWRNDNGVCEIFPYLSLLPLRWTSIFLPPATSSNIYSKGIIRLGMPARLEGAKTTRSPKSTGKFTANIRIPTPAPQSCRSCSLPSSSSVTCPPSP